MRDDTVKLLAASFRKPAAILRLARNNPTPIKMSARLKMQGLKAPQPKLRKSTNRPNAIRSIKLLMLPPQNMLRPTAVRSPSPLFNIRVSTAKPMIAATPVVTCFPRHLSGRSHSKLKTAPLFSL